MLSLAQVGPDSLPTPNFTVSWDPSANQLMDQDYVHNIKKLVNPLDHATKSLRIGEI